MFSLICYVVVVFFLMCVAYLFSWKRLPFSPAILFIFGLLVQAFYALFWVDEWELDLHILTFLVLTGGIVMFIISTVMTQIFFPVHELDITSVNNCSDRGIYVGTWYCVFCLFLQFVTILWILSILDGDSISEKINSFYIQRATTDSIAMTLEYRKPFWYTRLSQFVTAYEYIFMFIFSHNIVEKNWKKLGIVICIILVSLVRVGITGSRGLVVMNIDMILFMICIKYAYCCNWDYWPLFIKIIKLLPVGVITALLFQPLNVLLGRSNDAFEQYAEYFAVYLSAPLKNFDILVREGVFAMDFTHMRTLEGLRNSFAYKFGLPEFFNIFENAQNYVNEHWIGNAATTFYHFYWDGGFFGVFVYIVIMAVICQWLYLHSLESLVKYPNEILISIICLSYVLHQVLLSFFCHAFYLMVAQIGNIEIMFYMVLIKRFMISGVPFVFQLKY